MLLSPPLEIQSKHELCVFQNDSVGHIDDRLVSVTSCAHANIFFEVAIRDLLLRCKQLKVQLNHILLHR